MDSPFTPCSFSGRFDSAFDDVEAGPPPVWAAFRVDVEEVVPRVLLFPASAETSERGNSIVNKSEVRTSRRFALNARIIMEIPSFETAPQCESKLFVVAAAR